MRTALDAENDAWDLLADEKYGQAVQHFRRLAEDNPNEAAPRIGYALASAALGRYERCAWAIRRAFRYDPEGVDRIRLDEQLRPLVNDAIRWYRDRLDADEADTAAEFMLAALNYLQGDMKSARDAVDRALRGGNRSVAATNLKRMLSRVEDLQESRQASDDPPRSSDDGGSTSTPKKRTTP